MYKTVFVAFVLFGAVIQIYGELNPYLEALHRQPWKSEQGYVQVRPGAYIFYWLYYADGTANQANTKPLIIWIQGGPGLAASGVGNFAEIGPFNMEMKPRSHTWVKGKNVLLIDHPVGTGFSYVTNNTLYVKTDREIATDLSRAIKMFLKRHKQFYETPTYIFGQSYGGKIAPRLGCHLNLAIKRGKLKMNFKGIGIGSGWVSPKESSLIYPQYLYNLGAIDKPAYLVTRNLVKKLIEHIDKKDFVNAGKIDMELFDILTKESENINLYNINKNSPISDLENLSYKINRYVKPTLANVVNQSINWNYLSDDVYSRLNESFLVPSTKFLEMLLNETKIKIVVYNGNLDVITPVAGASNWASKLNWNGAEEFRNSRRMPIIGVRNGFYKTARQFSFWWVFGSGHWVPEDNPVAMKQILDYMTQ